MLQLQGCSGSSVFIGSHSIFRCTEPSLQCWCFTAFSLCLLRALFQALTSYGFASIMWVDMFELICIARQCLMMEPEASAKSLIVACSGKVS